MEFDQGLGKGAGATVWTESVKCKAGTLLQIYTSVKKKRIWPAAVKDCLGCPAGSPKLADGEQGAGQVGLPRCPWVQPSSLQRGDGLHRPEDLLLALGLQEKKRSMSNKSQRSPSVHRHLSRRVQGSQLATAPSLAWLCVPSPALAVAGCKASWILLPPLVPPQPPSAHLLQPAAGDRSQAGA